MAEQALLIKKCSCTSEYQDNRFGPGMRLFNRSGKKDGVDKCSVCNNGLNVRGGGVMKKDFIARPRNRQFSGKF